MNAKITPKRWRRLRKRIKKRRGARTRHDYLSWPIYEKLLEDLAHDAEVQINEESRGIWEPSATHVVLKSVYHNPEDQW